MSDKFYCDFDQEYLLEEDGANPVRRPDYRTPFHKDRDRIMFSPAFRRLQAKTQVFQAGEYDFYRTRLTHSLEVSRIAESIAIFLRKANPEVCIDLHLLESICLAHDIGHPPFGHAGERVLNKLMARYGGFEGNAQTLRLLTRTIYDRSDSRTGMSPSRALLDGVLKYKRLYRDRGKDTNHFIYNDQADILTFCFKTKNLARKLGKKVNDFKSLECEIMDLADDIAYSCFDIVDGTKARFLTPDKIDQWKIQQGYKPADPKQKYLDGLRNMMAENKLSAGMNLVIGELIQSTSLAPKKNFMTPKTRRHAYSLIRHPQAKVRIKLYKDLAKNLIFGSSAIQQLEHKGGQILKRLAETLFDNYLQKSSRITVLLPSDVHHMVLKAKTKAQKARLLCDHLSGMTDAYALRNYKRLLDPDYGSISELI